MFQRGRIDHFALNVADAETFARLRHELVGRGLTDGEVTDFGVLRVLKSQLQTGMALSLRTGSVPPILRNWTWHGRRMRRSSPTERCD